ncbi:hypothetical protein, conserved [Trypanosoma brucei gambiense DAL972]|uniref:Uncharacterized protein n=1 Tax=Trypanosoma brucei gambiense (strain MHOM/CI/86/DAL972) TaxID=679716 RepID=D0A3J3_TRYB9|nr:hypothetical protein, conserved [Trypanosoma brucei gambiense DAL972]CBH15837.1 hypothetical protein, conserved [Trypanosoma brucei gambiense DAL972]|eukprot:XP_011778101.1 hypothetical protein, conserved [Trypanosoma brucei gambiense DAL972]
MSVERIVQILSVVYAAEDNGDRRRATFELHEVEEQMNSEEIVSIGTGLLAVTDRGAAVQAYGAVLLRNAVVSGRIPPSVVPYEELMTWYFNEPTLGRLLCADIVELLIECMVREWPESYPDLIARVCAPPTQLAQQPRKLHFLSSFIAHITSPHVGGVPVNRMKRLKKAIELYGRTILVEVIQALFDLYTQAGGAASNSCAPGTKESVTDCLMTVANATPCLPVHVWSEVGLTNTLSALVRWGPAAQEALAATTALLRCDRLSCAGESTAADSLRTELLNVALGSVDMWVAESNHGNIEEVVGLLHDSPDTLLQPAAPVAGRVCLLTLSIPSVLLASVACSIFRRLGDAAFTQINPLELLARLAVLVPKNKLHPCCGTCEGGMQISEHDFGTVEAFTQAFSEFRSLAAHVLTSVARIYPVVANQFMLQLVSNLSDSRGTEEDARTQCGFVTQRSDTFCNWEATQFLLYSLSESFKHSSEYVPQIINELVKREPEDMVIFPVYLNMLSLLWNCRDDTALGVWQGTMGIILKSLGNRYREVNDIDVVSARKRALTLLVTACSKHAKQLVLLGEPFLCQMERLLMFSSTSAMERTLLYEAIAAFTTALPEDEAQRRLQSFLDPVAKIMVDHTTNMCQNAFNDIIIGRTTAQRDEGYVIRDSINVFAGVLRRCKTLPYVVEAASSLVPSIMKLMEFAHNIDAKDLPPEYKTLFGTYNGDGGAASHLRSREGEGAGGRKSDVYRARKILLDIRLALYQVIGALSSFFSVEPLENMLQMLVCVTQLLPIHAMRQLLSHCLFPVASAQERLIPATLSVCTTFYMQRNRGASRAPEAEAVDGRQLFGLSKDIFAFIRQNVVDPKRLDGNPALCQIVVDVTLSVLESGVNVAEASRFISAIVPNGNDANRFSGTANAQMVDMALCAYSRMIDFAVRADESLLPPREREKLLVTLADTYVSQYPLYVTAMKDRYPQPQVDELNTHLTMMGRIDVKRRYFKEFLQRFAGQVCVDGGQVGDR